MAIKHPFTSLVTDIGGPTYVQPTHWNSGHNSPPFTFFQPALAGTGTVGASFGIPSSASWGQIAAAFPDAAMTTGGGGFDFGSYDFTYVDTIVLGVGLASIQNTGGVAAGSVALRLQYAASGFPGSWYAFDATGGSGPFVSLATAANASQYLASQAGLMRSASVTVSAAAKALPQPLMIRAAGAGGNGSAVLITELQAWAF